MSATFLKTDDDARHRPRAVLPQLPPGAGFLRTVKAILDNPLALYTDAHYEKPMVTTSAGGRTIATVMDPDLVQTVLMDVDTFVKAPSYRTLLGALRDGLLTSEGEVWRRQRRAAAPAFRQRALDALVPTFDSAGRNLAERLRARDGEAVDVHPEQIAATFEVIVETLFQNRGTEEARRAVADDVDRFLHTIGKISLHELFPVLNTLLPRRFFISGYAEGDRAVKRLRAYAEAIIAERMADGAEDRTDLMGLLITAEDPKSGERLTPTQLVDNALTFIGAGHETTALALTWALYILAEMPELQDALAEEVRAVAGDGPITAENVESLALHERVLKEAMRLFPPVCDLPREVATPTTLGGLDLKPKDVVSVAIFPMQRHRDLWSDPLVFDPDRFLPEAEAARHKYAYLPFGGGPRICIGMRFAIMEGVVLLAAMMRAVKVAPAGEAVAEPHLAVTMRPKDGMRLKIVSRTG